MNIDVERYFLKQAAAFVRGRFVQGHPMDLPDALRDESLKDLSEPALLEIFQIGQAAALEMHKFKRTTGLARVRRAYGVLRSLTPEDLLCKGRPKEPKRRSGRFLRAVAMPLAVVAVPSEQICRDGTEDREDRENEKTAALCRALATGLGGGIMER
jgi:hypothetical protein